MGRWRNRGKPEAKACTLTSRRRKAAALTAKLRESMESLGDPRDSMSLEEKKRLALFFYFSQVFLGGTYLHHFEFVFYRGKWADPKLFALR